MFSRKFYAFKLSEMPYSSSSTAEASPPSGEESQKHRLYRTKQCKHYLKGFCLFGGKCCFAHGGDEVLQKQLHSSNHDYSPRLSLVSTTGSAIGSTMYSVVDSPSPAEISSDEIRKSLVDELVAGPGGRPRSMSHAELTSLFKGW